MWFLVDGVSGVSTDFSTYIKKDYISWLVDTWHNTLLANLLPLQDGGNIGEKEVGLKGSFL